MTDHAMDAEELPATPLPCPFCGREQPVLVDQGGEPHTCAIACGWCGAVGPSGAGFDIEDAQAALIRFLAARVAPSSEVEPDADMRACYRRHGEVLRQLCETEAKRDALKRRVEALESEVRSLKTYDRESLL